MTDRPIRDADSREPALTIRGARVHNLQNVSLDLPRERLVVFTGVSGSGKSSLAFDTIYAEAQRQYLESLSLAARQAVAQLERPDVDQITGLGPSLALAQQAGRRNPRSTVATLTEIYDYLRLLFARCGTPHCPECGTALGQQTPQQILESLAGSPEGTRAMILAPLVRARRGAHLETQAEIRRRGFVRARIDGQIHDVEHWPELEPRRQHTIEAVVDRVLLGPLLAPRTADSLQQALELGQGTVVVTIEERAADGPRWSDRLYSTELTCLDCGVNLPPLEPRLFSFHSPHGACPACQGLGRKQPTGAVERGERTERVCAVCGGARLAKIPQSVRWHGLSIVDCCRQPIVAAVDWWAALPAAAYEHPVSGPLTAEIRRRLALLAQIGLDYLTLDRTADTLSGGELQRVRLTACLGAGLTGVCYVLDEPSVGLHPCDTQRLLQTLRGLQAQGNSVLVVEHDEEFIRAADYLVDLGPGAGPLGGQVVAQGTLAQVAAADSPTGRYLSGAERIARRLPRPEVAGLPRLVLRGAHGRNLRQLTCEVPLGALTCVCGVSGSGKSTLVFDTLAQALAARLHGATEAAEPFDELTGADALQAVVRIDQSPLGRTPRSTAATYTGAFDELRKLFAKTREARLRGYRPQRFSFNVPGGRCETCRGQGRTRIDLQFWPDFYQVCPDCRGARFNPQTLEVRFRGLSLAEVLELRVDDARDVFQNVPPLAVLLESLHEAGLGYLPLGQPATQLSGGEAQRVKLAAALARGQSAHTLYILDEPTTGLHWADVQRLLNVLERLVANGHSVVVVEHHLDLLAAADWLIDMGPGGGPAGGSIVAAGPPEVVAATPGSATGAALQAFYAARSGDATTASGQVKAGRKRR